MLGTGILKGLSITFRNLLRGPITVHYPDEKLVLPERSRWAVRPAYDETGALKCTACMACIRECPDDILALSVETGEDKSKRIVSFDYEVGACMMCGLCVEACPFDALVMSHEYELAVTDPELMTETLLGNIMAASPRRGKASAEQPAPKPEKEGSADA